MGRLSDQLLLLRLRAEPGFCGLPQVMQCIFFGKVSASRWASSGCVCMDFESKANLYTRHISDSTGIIETVWYIVMSK